MTPECKDALLALAERCAICIKGTLIGLALFAAWLGLIVLAVLSARHIGYFILAFAPVAFIGLGIFIANERARASQCDTGEGE